MKMPEFDQFMRDGGIIRIKDDGFAAQSTVAFNNDKFPPFSIPIMQIGNTGLGECTIKSLYEAIRKATES